MKVEEIHLALKKNQEVKVEFALIDDYAKEISDFEEENKKVVQAIKTLESYKIQFKVLDRDLQSEYKRLIDKGEDLYKKYNELGADSKQPFVLKNKVTAVYGKGWDMDAVKFLRS